MQQETLVFPMHMWTSFKQSFHPNMGHVQLIHRIQFFHWPLQRGAWLTISDCSTVDSVVCPWPCRIPLNWTRWTSTLECQHLWSALPDYLVWSKDSRVKKCHLFFCDLHYLGRPTSPPLRATLLHIFSPRPYPSNAFTIKIIQNCSLRNMLKPSEEHLFQQKCDSQKNSWNRFF